MWYLVEIKTGNPFYLLQDKPKYIISRTVGAGDIILQEDTSISRAHALIKPNKDNIVIFDTNSKYGTFINENINKNVRMKQNTAIKLIGGDLIRFGQMNNIWRVEELKFHTVSSTLSIDQKKSLDQDLIILNGILENQWSDNCTHLTMETITITIKVIQALGAAIPIVTPSFWKAMHKAAKDGTTLPKPEQFLPPVIEPYINKDVSFLVNINRKRLFAGKTFVFMIKQHLELYELAIKLAGGTCLSLDERKMHKTTLIKSDVCVIQYQPSSQSQTSQDIMKISEYLHSKKLRTIPDCEIGLAIVNCSMVKFCNPKYKLEDDFLFTALPVTIQSKILAEGTASNNYVDPNPIKMYVPETIFSENEKLIKNNVQHDSNVNSEKSKAVSTAEIEQKMIEPHQVCLDTDQPEIRIPIRQSKRNKLILSPAIEPPSKKQALHKSAEKSDNDCITLDSEEVFQQDTQPFFKEPAIAKKNDFVADKQTSKVLCHSKRKQCDPLNELQHLNKKQSLEKEIETSDIPSTENSLITDFGFTPRPKITDKINKTLQVAGPSTSITNKRPHQLLCDAEDDSNDSGEDVFQFDEKFAKKSKRDYDCYTQDTFLSNNTELNSTEPVDILPKRVQPVKINFDTWISISLKKELNISDDSNKSSISEENKDWINNISKAFVVEIKPMKLVSVQLNRSSAETAGNNSISNTTLRPKNNFKAFTKKLNYRPQTKVLVTNCILP